MCFLLQSKEIVLVFLHFKVIGGINSVPAGHIYLEADASNTGRGLAWNLLSSCYLTGPLWQPFCEWPPSPGSHFVVATTTCSLSSKRAHKFNKLGDPALSRKACGTLTQKNTHSTCKWTMPLISVHGGKKDLDCQSTLTLKVNANNLVTHARYQILSLPVAISLALRATVDIKKYPKVCL